MSTRKTVSADDLREVMEEVEGKKPTQRLMAAINYLEDDDLTQKAVAERYGYTGGWLSRWLQRFERLADEPFEDVVYDEHRPGRPSALSEAESKRFVDALHEPPENSDLDAPAWTVPLAAAYLETRFGVNYCDRHVRRLLTKAGLSRQSIRSQCTDSDEHTREANENSIDKRSPAWTARK